MGEMTGPTAETLGVDSATREKLMELRQGFPAHEKMFGSGLARGSAKDMTWLGVLPNSGKLYLRLTEEMGFKPKFDAQIKPKLDAVKSASECLTSEPFATKIEEIKGELTKERAKALPPRNPDDDTQSAAARLEKMKQEASKILGVDESDAGDVVAETLDVTSITEKEPGRALAGPWA